LGARAVGHRHDQDIAVAREGRERQLEAIRHVVVGPPASVGDSSVEGRGAFGNGTADPLEGQDADPLAGELGGERQGLPPRPAALANEAVADAESPG
jgi:hypothetical protein